MTSKNFYRPAEVDILKGDSSKARKILGWKPKVSFDQMIEKMINHDLEQLKGKEDKELLGFYQRAKVYVQPSYHESFGIPAAEPMLCECIPVVTRRFALPEVVGEAGFYVPYGDEKATAEVIKKALNSPENFGGKARERIKKNFPLEKRERELVKIVNSLKNKKSNKGE
ncbi:GDP-D-mannose dehydratase [Thermoplasmatales archaeon SCGC AB-539-C06]|nr:GDP-D-mannose dehydratase [Thermoplasmatales archaeon SCGC AB-539-C06]